MQALNCSGNINEEQEQTQSIYPRKKKTEI
jgi:hypothetical protein